jgi:hypothetical protein
MRDQLRWTARSISRVPIVARLACTCLIAHPALMVRGQTASPPSAVQRQQLLAVRDSVWRAFYANDQVRMRALVPDNLVAINPGDTAWQSQSAFLADAAAFARQGGRLVSLSFPRTEIQVFGTVAVLYSRYDLRFEVGGAQQSVSGRATEVFVLDHGRWRNPGWHLDSGR